jgi:hypothetical protein
LCALLLGMHAKFSSKGALELLAVVYTRESVVVCIVGENYFCEFCCSCAIVAVFN